MKIDKVIRLGTVRDGSIFARIQFADGKLSITGVIEPMANGNSRGSAGQCIMSFKEYDWRGYQSVADITPAPGWTPELVKRFFDAWDRWHLNDMKAGTPAQEAFLRANPINDAMDHYGKACAALKAAGLNPDGGYRYGSAWLKEEVPADVLEFLCSLPDTDVKPAWV